MSFVFPLKTIGRLFQICEVTMSNPIIYDKAKFHLEGNFPAELERIQAFIHTGFYLGWLCKRSLTSGEFNEDFEPEIAEFRDGTLTAPNLYRISGGVLADDMLDKLGNEFTEVYFDLSHGQFLRDYQEVFGPGLRTMYHVRDTWENFSSIEKRLDMRFNEWLNRRNT